MWIDDKFYYSKGLLRTIARNYTSIYQGLPIRTSEEVMNPWGLAEYKADFDLALNDIGRGEWGGLEGLRLKDYRGYGRLQQVIISDIIGVDNYELEQAGFYNIPQLKGYGYYLMCKFLNGG